MSFDLKPITPAQLTTSAVAYLTGAIGIRAGRAQKVVVTNSTATDRTVTTYHVPPGGTAGATNIVHDAFTILKHTTQELYELEGLPLNAGWTIQAKADAGTAVTITGGWVEFN